MGKKQQTELRLFAVSCPHDNHLVWCLNHRCSQTGIQGSKGLKSCFPPGIRVPLGLLGRRMFQGKANGWREGMETKHLNRLHGRRGGEPKTRSSGATPGDEARVAEEPAAMDRLLPLKEPSGQRPQAASPSQVEHVLAQSHRLKFAVGKNYRVIKNYFHTCLSKTLLESPQLLFFIIPIVSSLLLVKIHMKLLQVSY